MPRRMSNRDRIDRLRAEADAKKREKKDRPPPPQTARKPAAGTRMKIVWAVQDGRGNTKKTFPYPNKPAAQAEAQRLIEETGNYHCVRPDKVPMEE